MGYLLHSCSTGYISFFRITFKIINFFLRFSQDVLKYCIVAKSYDEQTKLDKKLSTVRKNEMHLQHQSFSGSLIQIGFKIFFNKYDRVADINGNYAEFKSNMDALNYLIKIGYELIDTEYLCMKNDDIGAKYVLRKKVN